MRRDADEAARRLASAGIRAPVATLCQAIAQLLSGDLKLADQFFADTIRAGADGIAPDVLTTALSEQALRAVTDNRWDQARLLADQAAAVLGQAGTEESWVTPLSSAAQARVALHDGDIQAVRRQLASAQRTRRWLTYALPHLAAQARIELARLHLATGDVAAAQVLMRETDRLLQRRPGLGVLVDQAGALQAQLAEKTNSAAPGASALTGAELRLLPWLSTHLSFTEIAAELTLAPTTIRSQAYSLYKKLGVSSRNSAVGRARELALLG
jgi:LuxR family maltose regulon positive regulatory protein